MLKSTTVHHQVLGDHGPEIRCVCDGKPVVTPHYAAEIYGPVTAVHWVKRAEQKRDFILFGTHCGWLILWGSPGPVSARPRLCDSMMLTSNNRTNFMI
jgi:hypothetical protein